MRYSIAIATVLILTLGRGPTWAQTAADKAAADTLFNEGKTLIAAGDAETACAKFEASLAKVTQLGAQLALASCYEKLGRTASAWGEFRAAASAAGKARDVQRQRFAEQHAAALEARLSRLVIKVEPGYRIDGLEVKRDGVDVSPAELGSPVPVDPGDHVVEASAPGWVAWSTKVSVAAQAGIVEVIVPALGKAPVKVEEPQAEVAAVPPRPAPDPGDPQHRRRYLAYGLAGGGLAAIGTSLILGAMASSRWSDAQTHCHGKLCDPTGVDLAGSAGTLGNVSTGAFLVGTAALAAGVILYLTSPSVSTERPPGATATALRIAPDVGGARVGLLIQGGF